LLLYYQVGARDYGQEEEEEEDADDDNNNNNKIYSIMQCFCHYATSLLLSISVAHESFSKPTTKTTPRVPVTTTAATERFFASAAAAAAAAALLLRAPD
jgi:hypothetical protein